MFTSHIHVLPRLVFLILFLFSGLIQANPITVTDTENREVVVPEHPQRVLLGFYFEDFYAIVGPDAYDRVVAISKDAWAGWRPGQWKNYLAVTPRLEQLADVGEVDSGTFNIEVAIASNPDVAVFAAWQFRALGEVVVDKLEAAGIPVVVVDFNAQTVEMHEKSAMTIGKLMGAEARAKQLVNEYKAAVADVSKRVAASNQEKAKKRVYVELGNKGPDTYGNSYGNTMWGRVIEMAGGDNIAATKLKSWGPLNPEYVLASDPEVIIILGSAWQSRPQAVLMGFGVEPEATVERLRPYMARPGWSNLAAVKHGEIHSLYHGGARTLYDYAFLQYIAKRLYPEAFTDIDPVATHRRFYETYLPIAADGTFMLQVTN